MKQLVRTRTDINCSQMNAVIPMLFVASYSYSKTRANTHATVIKLSFGRFFVIGLIDIYLLMISFAWAD